MRIRTNSRWFSSILCVFFFTMPLWRATIFHILPAGNVLLFLVLMALIVLSVMTVSNGLVKYVDVFVLYVILAAVLGTALILNPSIRVWLTREFGIRLIVIQGSIFVYPVIRLQQTPEIMMKNLKTSAIMLGIYYLYMTLEPIRYGYWTYIQFGRTKVSSSNMSWSYGVLFVILVFSACAILEKKPAWFIPSAMGLLLILLYGSRGSIVAYAVAAALYILFGKQNKLNWKKALLVLFSLLFAIFIFSDFGVNLIKNVVESLDIKSRFVDTFVHILEGGDLDEESSGRDQIWKLVIRLIKKQPQGYGPMGHRNYIYRIGIKWGYSHDLFLDWLAEYGVFFGSLLILGLFFIIFRQFRKCKNLYERLLLIVFIGVSCEMLMSAYYWIHIGVWSLLALYMNHFKSKWNKKLDVEKSFDTKSITELIKGGIAK